MNGEKIQKGTRLAARLAKYSGEALIVSAELPDTRQGRHVEDQLMRSGSAPGAHYAEARSAQSAADFIYKVSLAAKEARESLHWLRTAVCARYLDRDVSWLIREGEELVAILAASLRTAQKNRDARAAG